MRGYETAELQPLFDRYCLRNDIPGKNATHATNATYYRMKVAFVALVALFGGMVESVPWKADCVSGTGQGGLYPLID